MQAAAKQAVCPKIAEVATTYVLLQSFDRQPVRRCQPRQSVAQVASPGSIVLLYYQGTTALSDCVRALPDHPVRSNMAPKGAVCLQIT